MSHLYFNDVKYSLNDNESFILLRFWKRLILKLSSISNKKHYFRCSQFRGCTIEELRSNRLVPYSNFFAAFLCFAFRLSASILMSTLAYRLFFTPYLIYAFQNIS